MTKIINAKNIFNDILSKYSEDQLSDLLYYDNYDIGLFLIRKSLKAASKEKINSEDYKYIITTLSFLFYNDTANDLSVDFNIDLNISENYIQYIKRNSSKAFNKNELLYNYQHQQINNKNKSIKSFFFLFIFIFVMGFFYFL